MKMKMICPGPNEMLDTLVNRWFEDEGKRKDIVSVTSMVLNPGNVITIIMYNDPETGRDLPC